MSVRAATRCGFLALLLVLTWLSPAYAWIETSVRGHRARVEVERDGTAIVRHELLIKVRGGPMKSLEIGGIGTEIEPLPDASVKLAVEGSSGMWPLTASSMEDGALRLSIESERGIRGGTYLFSFAYSMNLLNAGLLERQGERMQVSWIGPRLSTGVDSAKVTFVIPRGELEPSLAAAESSTASVLLGELRRGAEQDEIDLVRAHLATGEPAVWRVLSAADAFGQQLAADASAEGPVSGGLEQHPAAAVRRRVEPQYREWLIALLFAVLAGALHWKKARDVTRAAQLVDARVLALVPAHPLLRGCLIALLSAGFVVATLQHYMWWALGCVAGALVLGTFLLPVRRVIPRGPGVWQRLLNPSKQKNTLPGAWFDTRSLPGLGLLVVLVGGLLAFAYRILPTSNYLALMSLLAVALWVPLFWTGSRRDMPQSAEQQALPWFRYINQALDPAQVSVELWGRRQAQLDVDAAFERDESDNDVPVGDTASKRAAAVGSVDEARVRLVMKEPPAGLRAFEVTLDEAAGAHVMPCILLRVMEDSPAFLALPRELSWRRGRSPEERVALLRPAAPTYAQTVRLVRSLLTTLLAAQRSRSARRSSGKGEVTSKGAIPATLQAT